MTRDEQIAVIKILATADGGCGPCVASLCTLFNRQFPGLTATEVLAILQVGNALPYLEADDVMGTA